MKCKHHFFRYTVVQFSKETDWLVVPSSLENVLQFDSVAKINPRKL